jgi:hypothetical protein
MKRFKSHITQSSLLIFALWLGLCSPLHALGQQTEPGALYPVYRNGKWGYNDRNGKVVIKPQFEVAYSFINGMAQVWRNKASHESFIDMQGREIADRNFASNHFSEGLMPVKIEKKYGYVDEQVKMIIFPQFEDAGDFSEGLAPVKRDGKWGYVDHQGRVVIAPQFSSADSFHEGLALVGIPKEPPSQAGESLDERFLLSICSFTQDEIFGFINKTGALVIAPQFDRAWEFSDGRARVLVVDKKLLESDNPRQACKWGYLDQTGKIAVEPQFSEAGDFFEGLAPVRIGSKWGYIDTNGKVVIAPQFEYALNFTDGLALVAVGRTKTDWPYRGLTVWRIRYIGRQGYIDHTGKFVSDKLSWKSK